MPTTCLPELPQTARYRLSMDARPWSSSNKGGSGRSSVPTFPRCRIREKIHLRRGTMRITNPFADNLPTDLEDRALVARACAGDRAALEEVVRHHQGWIYNIALR